MKKINEFKSQLNYQEIIITQLKEQIKNIKNPNDQK